MAIPFIQHNRTTLKVPIYAPQQTVWELLATPQGIPRWFALACEGEIGEDTEFRLIWSPNPRPEDVSMHKVTAFDPPRRFGFTWPAVHLTFELARQNTVTVLKLQCTYVGDSTAVAELQIEELVGWTMHLLTLKSIAEGGIDLRTPGRTFSWDKGFITGV
ncbi:MAG: SRPBCC domain-containing protein [Anaerolineae bacterium]